MIQSQLLESMVRGDEPERRELAEISHLALLGADCLMLTHETSIGCNPLSALTTLSKAIAEAEQVFDYD